MTIMTIKIPCDLRRSVVPPKNKVADVAVGVGVAVIRVNLNSNMPFACKQKATEHRQPRMR